MLYLPGFPISAVVSVAAFVSGVWFFRLTERFFADFL